MYNRSETTDRELADILPHVMGTQHPDNASAVPFGDGPAVSRDLEEEEVLYNVTELGLREMMIDYERKRAGTTPLWDWVHRCHTCLENRVIGRDFHVTPRLPNGDKDRDDPYFWQSLGIFINSLPVMKKLGYPGMAFSEFIIPDVSDGATVAKIERAILERYRLQSEQYERFAGGSAFPFEGDFHVQGVPLIEAVEDLLEPEPIWEDIIRLRKQWTGRETYIQRSFIARSDPALKAGLPAALIAAAVALEKGRRFENRTGVRVPQIVGIGPSPFRGGLTPESRILDVVLDTYPGMATVTVQSAFRYDHDREDVTAAVGRLEKALAEGWLQRGQLPSGPENAEAEELKRIVAVFKEAYESSYRALQSLVMEAARNVPSHRERYGDVSLAGEARQVSGMPAVRAIKFAASCYSLGMPPGLIGLRAWKSLSGEQQALVERFCPTLRFWIEQEQRWLCAENPAILERRAENGGLTEDAETARGMTPKTEAEPRHAEIVAEVPRRLEEGKGFTDLVMQAARVRNFLG
jgi:phosphoenolpyruvate carboxylase